MGQSTQKSLTRRLVELTPRPVKASAKSLLESNVARSLYFDFRYFIQHKTPIIVVQMGKVGSKSVVHSLELHRELVYHAHSLNAGFLRQRVKELEPIHARGLYRWIWMHDHIIQRRNAKVKYITLVRDPNAINVAGFFENLDRFTGVPHAYRHFTLEELFEKFEEMDRHESDYELGWFDRSIKVVPGIDVFEHPFDREAGYGRIQQGQADLLILKTELPDSAKEQYLADFLELPDFKLVNTNIGDEKAYADVYKQFKAQIIIPEHILERRANSKYMRHFYTNNEIVAITAKWRRES